MNIFYKWDRMFVVTCWVSVSRILTLTNIIIKEHRRFILPFFKLRVGLLIMRNGYKHRPTFKRNINFINSNKGHVKISCCLLCYTNSVKVFFVIVRINISMYLYKIIITTIWISLNRRGEVTQLIPGNLLPHFFVCNFLVVLRGHNFAFMFVCSFNILPLN